MASYALNVRVDNIRTIETSSRLNNKDFYLGKISLGLFVNFTWEDPFFLEIKVYSVLTRLISMFFIQYHIIFLYMILPFILLMWGFFLLFYNAFIESLIIVIFGAIFLLLIFTFSKKFVRLELKNQLWMIPVVCILFTFLFLFTEIGEVSLLFFVLSIAFFYLINKLKKLKN